MCASKHYYHVTTRYVPLVSNATRVNDSSFISKNIDIVIDIVIDIDGHATIDSHLCGNEIFSHA